jgi:hypothetical protein
LCRLSSSLALGLPTLEGNVPRLFVCYSRLASDNGNLCADNNETGSSSPYDLVSPLVGLWRQKFLGKPGRDQPNRYEIRLTSATGKRQGTRRGFRSLLGEVLARLGCCLLIACASRTLICTRKYHGCTIGKGILVVSPALQLPTAPEHEIHRPNPASESRLFRLHVISGPRRAEARPTRSYAAGPFANLN